MYKSIKMKAGLMAGLLKRKFTVEDLAKYQMKVEELKGIGWTDDQIIAFLEGLKAIDPGLTDREKNTLRIIRAVKMAKMRSYN